MDESNLPPACSLVSTTCTAGSLLTARQSHLVDRNAAAVIDDSDRVVEVNDGIDARCMAGKRFVDRIVDNLVDQMMQSHLAGRPDIHRRSQTYCFQTFEHFDIASGIAAVFGPFRVVVVWFEEGCCDLFSGHETPSLLGARRKAGSAN